MAEFVITRGEEEQSDKGRKFDRIMYSYIIKSNKEVSLTGLSFFGPHHSGPDPVSQYTVTVEIKRSSVGGQGPPQRGEKVILFPESGWLIPADKGKKFHVQFGTPVAIPEYTWIDVRFQLDGPETGFLREADIFKLTHEVKTHGVQVHCLIGSGQLADLHFFIKK